MRPNQAFHALEILRNSFSVPLYRKGVVLSHNDSSTVLDVYQQWLLLTMDLGYLHSETLSRDAQRLWVDMIQVDVYTLNSCFAECLQSIRLQNIRGFKGLCSGISKHLWSLIRDDVLLIPMGDVYAAKRLIQLFSYTSRLSLVDIDMTQQLLDDYLATEERILSEFPDRLVQSLNRIIRRWIGVFCPGDLHPQHGPGAVANLGRCSIEEKYKNLLSDQRLEYAFGDPIWASEAVRSKLERTSQTIFVPKSYKTFRTISMEPATLQYFQQGVWKLIDHQVSRSTYLRSHIGFHDETRNMLLAKEGSSCRNFATLDLSAASDSVSYALVKKLFKGTWLPRFLLATRSTRTLLPDSRIIDLKKFAPMGSALCFPIETIIFASICEYVTREHRVPGKYSVFGDDIVVPTQCVGDTMSTLSHLGFIVNNDKSFHATTCWFRESCGGEYCDGFDVSPLRVSRKYASRDPLVRLTKLISLANSAYDRGFRNLRYFFVRRLRDSGYHAMFSPLSLHGDSCSNYHLKKRWNRDLQRVEVYATQLHAHYAQEDTDSQDEAIRFRHWLETTAERKSLGDGFQSVICKPTVLVQDSWMNKFYEEFDQPFIDSSTGRGNFPPR